MARNPLTRPPPPVFSMEGDMCVQDRGELQLIPAVDVAGTCYRRYTPFPSQEKGLRTVFVNSKLNACVLAVSTQERYLTSKLQRHKVPNSSHPSWNFVQEMTHQIFPAWIPTNSNTELPPGHVLYGETLWPAEWKGSNLSVRAVSFALKISEFVRLWSREKRDTRMQPTHDSSQSKVQRVWIQGVHTLHQRSLPSYSFSYPNAHPDYWTLFWPCI